MFTDMHCLQLIPALQKPGCPVCRLRNEHEQRCIENLLLDHIMDGEVLDLTSASIGFCPKHTWLMGLVEIANDRDANKNSMVYEQLIKQLTNKLVQYDRHETGRFSPEKIIGRKRKNKMRSSFLADPFKPLVKSGCQICQVGDNDENFYLHHLLIGLSEGRKELQQQYLASDGLCLAHFRKAFTDENLESSEGLKFLVEATISKLTQLKMDVTGYIDKHAWDKSHEEFTRGEISSYLRLFRFFGKNEEDLLSHLWLSVNTNEKVPKREGL